MKLLLTSSGISKELKNTFLDLIDKPAASIKITYVTTAAYGDEKNPAWLYYYKKQLNSYGITNIEDLDIRNKTEKELERAIANQDIIYVQGGNTFYLLSWMRKTGFDKLLLNFINQNKLYVGVSAGSYIVCPTIEMATWSHQDRNRYGVSDFSSLNLVPFLITAHFKKVNKQIIEKAVQKTQYPVIALGDGQAVLVNDNKWKVVGQDNREFYNGFQEKL